MAQEDDLRGLRKVMDFIIKYPGRVISTVSRL